MSIPDQLDTYILVLDVLARNNVGLSREDIVKQVADEISLSTEERNVLTKGGKPVYKSRLGWAISFLLHNKLLDERDGVFSISEKGRETHSLGMTSVQFSAYVVSPIFQNAGKRNSGKEVKVLT